MVRASSDKLIRLAAKRPAITARDAEAAGVPRRTLARLAERGLLRRVGRGLYASTEAEPSVHQSVVEVALRAPRAVVCLLSALEIHEVGVQAPFQVWIALPVGTHAPRLAGTVAVNVTRLSGKSFTEGVQSIKVNGARVHVYNLAKTITDCFKLRSKVGLDVALEALDEAWRARKVTMDELWRYAKVNRMTNVMRPYLESLAR